MKRKSYLIAYDIKDSKRLYKVAKIVYSYALGGQKSALEVPLSKSELKELIDELLKILKPEDKLNIVPIYPNSVVFGKTKSIKFQEGVIIV